MEKIAAVIITYCPDLQRLNDNIKNVLSNHNLQKLYVVDNASSNVRELQTMLKDIARVQLLECKSNIGIAAALNLGCKYAQADGNTWVLTLDQDSVLEPNILEEFCHYVTQDELGIVCPRIEDRNMGRQYAKSDHGTELINKCITSGNLVRLAAWNATGGYSEELFIDGVDFDFCIKIKKAGYQILRTNNVYLLQEVGHGHNLRLFGRTLSVMNHSPLRLYYIVRNYLYLGKKHRQMAHWSTEVAKRLFIVLCFERNRREKLAMMLRGVRDFWRGRMGKYND